MCCLEKPKVHSFINHTFELACRSSISLSYCPLKIIPEKKEQARRVKWKRPTQNEGSSVLQEEMELGPQYRRLTRPDDSCQLPEQLREKLTGSQSFQQT